MDKLDIMFDFLKEMREDQKEISRKNDEQTEKLIQLEVNVSRNTEDLSLHIEGVRQNRKSLKLQKQETNARLEILEKPLAEKINLKAIKKVLVWFGGSATAIYAIYRLYLLLQANGIL